jgi:hypothetical protein
MVQGLDGIDRLILGISPATLQETVFKCVGYMNHGTFKKGKLEEVYRPLRAIPEEKAYKLEEIYLASAAVNYEPQIYIKAGPFQKPSYKGLRG